MASSIFEWKLSSAVSSVAIFAIVYFVVTAAYQWYRLRNIPGPFLAGLTNLWLSWTFSKGEDAPFYKLGTKYGHLVRVAPNLLLTDDPEQLRKMFVPAYPPASLPLDPTHQYMLT